MVSITEEESAGYAVQLEIKHKEYCGVFNPETHSTAYSEGARAIRKLLTMQEDALSYFRVDDDAT
jgi:hypothetical protein